MKILLCGKLAWEPMTIGTFKCKFYHTKGMVNTLPTPMLVG